jgi:hypothetical protein
LLQSEIQALQTPSPARGAERSVPIVTMIRTYLIDPFTKTVTEVERIASGRGSESLNEIFDLLHCHKVKAVAMPSVGTDAILVDEEGLHKVDQEFFRCMLWPQEVFGGRALDWSNT